MHCSDTSLLLSVHGVVINPTLRSQHLHTLAIMQFAVNTFQVFLTLIFSALKFSLHWVSVPLSSFIHSFICWTYLKLDSYSSPSSHHNTAVPRGHSYLYFLETFPPLLMKTGELCWSLMIPTFISDSSDMHTFVFTQDIVLWCSTFTCSMHLLYMAPTAFIMMV